MKIFYGQASAHGVNLLVQSQLIWKRIIFNLAVVGTIFYAPWWVVVIVVAIGAFFWSPYYEIIAFGILADVLYGTKTLSFGGILGVLVATIILLAASYLKKLVR